MASRGQRASLPSSKKNEREKKTANLELACWNVRTMQDSEDRPQRRSALVVRELPRLDIDIAALSEKRFAEQGFLGEDRVGYTLFWSGKSKNEHRHSGVCFMIKTSIARQLQNLSVGHSDRIITLRLAVQDKQVCHCLAVCAHLLCRLNLE